MSEQTFEADTVEAALQKAATALGIDADKLEHEVVEKKEDFWGLGDTYVIKAWERGAAESAPAPQAEAAETVEPESESPQAAGRIDVAEAEAAPDTAEGEAESPVEETTAVAEEARVEDRDSEPAVEDDEEEASAQTVADFEPAAEGPVEPDQVGGLLAQIFHDMEFDCTVEVEAEDDGFSATISGPDKEELLEGNGRCLSALELLVNNAFRNRMSRGEKIRVDAGDFRSRRDQELTDLAYQVAHSAKESGETQETQELNPYERRLVHLALAEDQAVTTKSRGSGFLKHVQVIPQKQGRGGRGRGRHR